MGKNVNKFILAGVIFSVFIGITGYSIGMTYGNEVAKSRMISSKSVSEKGAVNTDDNGTSLPSQPSSDSRSSSDSSDKKEGNSKSSSSRKTPSNKNRTYSSGRSGGNSGGSSYSSGSSAPKLSASSVSIPDRLKDGTYYGTGKGYGGDVKVKVVVSGGKISDISVISQNETPGYYEKGAAVIGRILSSQSAGVDAVSGATYTSNGIKSAVADALKGAGLSGSNVSKAVNTGNDGALKAENDKMKKELEDLKKQAAAQIPQTNIGGLKDGTYEGEGKGFRGVVRVSVSIKDGKIEDIKVISHGDDDEYFNRAKALISDVKSRQTLKVDSVSGATFSSIGIKTAISDALKKAGMSSSDNSVSDEALKAKDKEIAEMKQNLDRLDKEIKKIKDSKISMASDVKVSSLRDGTYKGEGDGYKGKVKVSVTVKSGKIAKISVLENSDDQPYFGNATGVIDRVMDAQSVNVDTISGATYSSSGIKEAIADALSQASSKENTDTSASSNTAASSSEGATPNTGAATNTGTSPNSGAVSNTSAASGKAGEVKNSEKTEVKKDPNIERLKENVRKYRRETKDLREKMIGLYRDINDAPLKDGIFEGEGGGFRGKIKVRVNIESQKVTNIEVMESKDDKGYFDNAKEILNDITSSQKVKVDSISGATYSSLGIKEAVMDALENSRRAIKTSASEETPSDVSTSVAGIRSTASSGAESVEESSSGNSAEAGGNSSTEAGRGNFASEANSNLRAENNTSRSSEVHRRSTSEEKVRLLE